MSGIGDGVAAEVSARASRRLATIDPLLPEMTELPAGCDATFVAWDAERPDQPAAIAVCDHWEGEPGSIGLAWGAARRFRLIPSIGGPNVAAALDLLINQWRDHLAGVSAADGDDTAAGVIWPSRDAEGIRVLLRPGMAPRAVGFLVGLRPEASTWLAPLTRPAPVAYLQQGFVLPTERGAGVGSLLTAAFHAELSSAGVAVTLLHYSQANPLSTPFWSQQGYRPLWTTWEARPARTLK